MLRGYMKTISPILPAEMRNVTSRRLPFAVTSVSIALLRTLTKDDSRFVIFHRSLDRSNHAKMTTVYTDGRVIAVATAAAATPRLRTRIIGVNDAYRAASAIVCVQLLDYTADKFRTIRTVGKSAPLKWSRCRTMGPGDAPRNITRRKLLEEYRLKRLQYLRFPRRWQ